MKAGRTSREEYVTSTSDTFIICLMLAERNCEKIPGISEECRKQGYMECRKHGNLYRETGIQGALLTCLGQHRALGVMSCMSAFGVCSSRLGQEMEGVEQGRWLLIECSGVLHMFGMGPCGGPLKQIPGGEKFT